MGERHGGEAAEGPPLARPKVAPLLFVLGPQIPKSSQCVLELKSAVETITITRGRSYGRSRVPGHRGLHSSTIFFFCWEEDEENIIGKGVRQANVERPENTRAARMCHPFDIREHRLAEFSQIEYHPNNSRREIIARRPSSKTGDR